MRFAILVLFALAGCGYESVNNKLVGQVKKVHQYTPIICGDYCSADVSLGVMRNGVGSMSTQDVEVQIACANKDDYEKMAEKGTVVEIEYNVLRMAVCVPDHGATSMKVAP